MLFFVVYHIYTLKWPSLSVMQTQLNLVKWCVSKLNILSPRMRKTTICVCENKDADQLCSNCTADQRLCFRNTDSKIPLLRVSKVSSFYLYSVTVQPGLCRTWSETQIVGFPTHRLIYYSTVEIIFKNHCKPMSK